MGMTNPNPYKTSGDKGAAAELLVCADLLAKDYMFIEQFHHLHRLIWLF